MKYTTELFIKKAQYVHEGKYDYSLVQYISSILPVKIICKEHGVFEQLPSAHLRGSGCNVCGKRDQYRLCNTTESFIEKAQQTHKGLYDYSQVEYVNNKTPVNVMCKIHGVFSIIPSNHLRGRGCPNCSIKTKKITAEQFIERAQQIHKGLYEYSLVQYLNSSTKVSILCREHGVFEQTPHKHLQGQGCPKCRNVIFDKEYFLKKANIKYSNRYIYSEYIDMNTPIEVKCEHTIIKIAPREHLNGTECIVCKTLNAKIDSLQILQAKSEILYGDKYTFSNFKNSQTEISINCEEHGIFITKPYLFIKGHICPKCINEQGLIRKTNDFKRKVYEIYKDKFSVISEYHNNIKPITIKCPVHNEVKVIPKQFLKGYGCPKCNGRVLDNGETFIIKAKQIYGDKYIYDQVEYKNGHTPVNIKCERHGYFSKLPNDFLQYSGCPKCNMSKGEIEISTCLSKIGIEYEYQKRYEKLGNLSYDFYIPSCNLLIEYNGEQHYQYLSHFHSSLHDFHYQKHRDWLKRKFAKEQGISLLVIPYWKFEDIYGIIELNVSSKEE